jgi:hypothetical protein
LPTIWMCNYSPSLPMRYFMTLLLLWDAPPIGCHFGLLSRLTRASGEHWHRSLSSLG